VVRGAGDQPLAAQLDGEFRSVAGPVTIEMVPAALPVLFAA
jgi:diacylglycerol kinase family enzyme